MIMTRTRPTACPGSGGGALVETCNVDRRGKKDGTRGTRGPQRGRLQLPPLLFPRLTPLPCPPPPSPYSTQIVPAPATDAHQLIYNIHSTSHSQIDQRISSVDSLYFPPCSAILCIIDGWLTSQPTRIDNQMIHIHRRYAYGQCIRQISHDRKHKQPGGKAMALRFKVFY
jgi:hypothetical protein